MPYAARFLTLLTMGALLLAMLLLSGPQLQGDRHGKRLEVQRQLVARLGLTDLCLFTEAPYTRNLSLATTSQPFLNHPLAAASFPTGSLVAPPARLYPTMVGKGAP